MSPENIDNVRLDLCRIASELVQLRFLPTLESCRNIGQARHLVGRYEEHHKKLGMRIKELYDQLEYRVKEQK
jgi:hypothetical protein